MGDTPLRVYNRCHFNMHFATCLPLTIFFFKCQGKLEERRIRNWLYHCYCWLSPPVHAFNGCSHTILTSSTKSIKSNSLLSLLIRLSGPNPPNKSLILVDVDKQCSIEVLNRCCMKKVGSKYLSHP